MGASERFTDSSRALAVALGLALLLTPLLPSPSLRAQSELDALRQRDQELEAVRIEQKKAAETQAKLKEEIDAIGEDRRKLNQALIDGAAVNGSARLVGWVSGVVRNLQTGYLYHYAFATIVGLSVLLAWLLLRT